MDQQDEAVETGDSLIGFDPDHEDQLVRTGENTSRDVEGPVPLQQTLPVAEAHGAGGGGIGEVCMRHVGRMRIVCDVLTAGA